MRTRARVALLALVMFGALLAPVSAAAQADPPDQPRRTAPAGGVAPVPAASPAQINAAATMTYPVTTAADGGSGSLRQAFTLANSDAMPSIIVLSAGTSYTLTSCGPEPGEEDANANGDLDHTDTFPLTIKGAGSVLGPDSLPTIETTCGERVIHSTSGASVTIERVDIGGGDVVGNGGGVLSEGPLVVRHSFLDDNAATEYGGAIYAPSGVTIENSVVARNTAADEGAGGVDADDADVVAVNTLFFDNLGGLGGAIFGDAVTLLSSTVVSTETTRPLGGDVEATTLASTGSALLASISGQLCSLDSATPSGGYNYAEDNSCGLTAATDVIDTVTPTDQVLLPAFYLPAAGGRLHNKVPVSKCSGVDAFEQARPQGALCDIGATEYPWFTVPPIVLAADPLGPVVVADVLAGATTRVLDLPLLDPTVKVPPSKGTAVLAGNKLTYTADGSDDGLDTFFLEQCEATRTDCASIEVRVTIAGLSSRFFFTNVLRGGPASAEITFGKGAGDQFFVGDFNGDGVDDLAKRAIGSNVFTIRDLDGVATAADTTVGYGRPGDQVYVGDWDGNGTDTFAVRRGNQFFVKNSISPGPADVLIGYGKAADEVFVGDWDADGDDTFAVRRGNVFFVRNTVTTGPADNMFGYGRAADVVLVGDWDANGSDTFAVRRGNVIFVRNDFLTAPAEFSFGFGRATDELFPGDWNNDGLDTFAVRRIVR